MAWIHIDDAVNLILFALNYAAIRGAVNATAPHPVTNEEFTGRLALALHRPAIFPVPAFALKLAFGEMSEMLLASQRVLPTVAKSAGFRFQYPDLQAALENLLADSNLRDNRSSMRFLLVLVTAAILTAAGEMNMTVAQLVMFIRSSVQLKQPDRQVAEYLRQ